MDVLEALSEQHDETLSLLASLAPADWTRPSRCAGWTVFDVVLHLAQTDELALASVVDRFPERWGDGGASVDDAADAAVGAERDRLTPDELRTRWASGAADLRAALAGADPHARVRWVAGTLSVRTLVATRLAECWIHTGDVAAALGVSLDAGERLRHVARLAWRTLPYAFERAGRLLHGPVAFDLVGPAGERWSFVPDVGPATTTISGPGVDLCLVAARRVDPVDTALHGVGPDAAAVLDLVRTYA